MAGVSGDTSCRPFSEDRSLTFLKPQSSNLQRGNTQSSVGSSVNARRNQQNGVHQVLDLGEGRILCVADVRGELSKLNQLASDTGAKAIIHTGDFGFYGMYQRQVDYFADV